MTTLMHNDTLRLRALEPTDLDLLYAWENDATVWTVSDTAAPYSRQVLWQYLESYTGDIYQSRQLRLIIELNDGTAVGTELGLLIAPEHRGHGYGHMALQLARNYAAQHIGMRQLYVYIRTDNTTCLKLFLNFGFVQSGLLKSWVKRGRQYYDVALLQLLLS